MGWINLLEDIYIATTAYPIVIDRNLCNSA